MSCACISFAISVIGVSGLNQSTPLCITSFTFMDDLRCNSSPRSLHHRPDRAGRRYRSVGLGSAFAVAAPVKKQRRLERLRRLRMSQPYHRTGVALAVGPKSSVASLAELTSGQRVGVQVGSIASMMIGKRGVKTSPFAFEDEIMDALARGEIDPAAVPPVAIGWFNQSRPNERVRRQAVWRKPFHPIAIATLPKCAPLAMWANAAL